MPVDAAELKITVEKPATWGRRLTITVPADEIERERRQTSQRLAQRIRLPGFRKGRIPPQVMEKRFGPAIEQEAIERVMGEAYREAIRIENLHPITQGSIENVQYDAGADLTFNVDFDVRPEIELERVGGFRLQRPPIVVDDQAATAVIERLRHQNAVWHPVEAGDGLPADGDMVTVEITPIEAKSEARGQPRTYQIVLGKEQALPPIEDVLRTLAVGQEGEFTVQLPEDTEDPESEVKDHRIHVSMKEMKRPDLPELDDEFARAFTAFDTVDALRERIRADLERQSAEEADSAVRQQLVSSVIEANPFEVPDSMVNEYLKRLLPASEGEDEARIDEMRGAARPAAARSLQRMLVIERVAEMESLHATAAEIDARLAEIAEGMGHSPIEVRSRLQTTGRLHEIEEEITEEKVFDYLKSLSTIE